MHCAWLARIGDQAMEELHSAHVGRDQKYITVQYINLTSNRVSIQHIYPEYSSPVVNYSLASVLEAIFLRTHNLSICYFS